MRIIRHAIVQVSYACNHPLSALEKSLTTYVAFFQRSLEILLAVMFSHAQAQSVPNTV